MKIDKKMFDKLYESEETDAGMKLYYMKLYSDSLSEKINELNERINIFDEKINSLTGVKEQKIEPIPKIDTEIPKLTLSNTDKEILLKKLAEVGIEEDVMKKLNFGEEDE